MKKSEMDAAVIRPALVAHIHKKTPTSSLGFPPFLTTWNGFGVVLYFIVHYSNGVASYLSNAKICGTHVCTRTLSKCRGELST